MSEPLVSVVVVTYGGEAWVGETLAALRRHTTLPHELVLVDNASPDRTLDVLRPEGERPGVTLLVNDENVGFGPAVNQAAQVARGEHLCLLNSDAVVHEGWLEPLVEVLAGRPEVAAVIPRFLHPDGTLQEAGAVVGRDGRTVALGFDDPPDSPWNLFPRDIPYGTAACMLVRRSLFLAAGGFDPVYAPAYYEDVDLCFRLRRDGWRVRYEPRSTVTHARGASSASEWAATLIEEHRELFVSRWAAVLDRLPLLVGLPDYAHRMVAARDLDASHRLLVTAGSLAAGGGVAHALVAAYPDARVTLAVEAGSPDEAAPLLAAGVEVAFPPVDWDRFFHRRLFHYDVVVDAGGGPGAVVAGTQPQAARVSAGEVAGAGARSTMASAGIA